MKLYTKQGDDGFSCVASGEKLKKNENIFHILGTLDEASCYLGLAKCKCLSASLFGDLERVQKNLVFIMSGIAAQDNERYKISESEISFLEEKTDFYYEKSKPKKTFEFVLPGTSELSSVLNIARCTARKAERLMCSKSKGYTPCKQNLKYINRLSDFIFAAALYTDSETFKQDLEDNL